MHPYHDCDNTFCDCDIETVINKSVRRLIKDDRYLLEKEVNERSQTHKLAEYLQAYLPDWNVDCEYNKNLDAAKTLDFSAIVTDIRSAVQQSSAEYEAAVALSQELENIEERQFADETGELAFLRFTSNEIKNGYIKRVYPDIIAHLRGTTNNRIIVEAKRVGNTDQKARQFDLVKLALFTQIGGQYGYHAGYFIDLPKKIPQRFRILIEPCRAELIKRIDHRVYTVKVEAL